MTQNAILIESNESMLNAKVDLKRFNWLTQLEAHLMPNDRYQLHCALHCKVGS